MQLTFQEYYYDPLLYHQIDIGDGDPDSKSDLFRVSINDLVESKFPSDVKDLSTILDDNGYYGRHQIRRMEGPSYKDICVKVRVYMPYSVFTYEWPYGSYYNLTAKCFGKRSMPKALSMSQDVHFRAMCLYFIHRKDPIIDIETTATNGANWGGGLKHQYVHLIRLFFRLGFIKNNTFCIKSGEDMYEVMCNLFDRSYFFKTT